MYWNRATNTIIHVIFLRAVTKALETHNNELFIKYLIIFGAYIVLYEILEFSIRYWGRSEIPAWSMQIIQKKYLPKLILLENNAFEWFGTGKIVSIVEKWMERRGFLLDLLLIKGLSITVTFIFTTYMMFTSWISHGVIFLIWYIVVHILGEKLNNYMLKYRVKRYDAQNSFTKNLVKIIMSKYEILQSNKIEREITVLHWDLNDSIQANKKMVPYVHWFFRIPSWFVSFFKISIVTYLWFQILWWTMELSTLVWVMGSLILMHGTIDESVRFYKDITKEFTAVQKFRDLFDNTKQIEWFYNGKEFVYKNGDIQIKNIDYAYSTKSIVFDNFSCHIQWGKKTALVWVSGSWKTTLIKLIAWYLNPSSGSLLIDDQNLDSISLSSYYQNIWYLTQEPSIFDWTIRDNLLYALPQNTIIEQDLLEKVITLAKCEWIYDLKHWLDTDIWEKWVRLSGGQRQRLAIAKIMLKDPKIILLDEPTSALDSFAEDEVTKAMNNLFTWRTVIVVAHRLQTVKHADMILVLWNKDWEKAATILEKWTHEELIQQWWFYAKMLELQSGF